MTSKDDSKYSFIMYSKNQTPHYYELKKNSIRFLTMVFPLVTALCLFIAGGILLYFKEIRDTVKKTEPVIIQRLKEENLSLTKKLDNEQKLADELKTKLSTTKVDENFPRLGLFSAVPGQKDYSGSPVFSISDVDVSKSSDKITFNFNLINITKEQRKKAGHLFIVLKSRGFFQVYPSHGDSNENMQLAYTQGESFATSRFRPFKAEFYNPNTIKNLLFQVVIFSRTGDLLHKQIIQKSL